MNKLIVICGPTASGKTSLGIQIAKKFTTEIISADSRQFYKEMSIGTAKPTQKELNEVPHHFINSLTIDKYYSAGDFEEDALQRINQLFQKHTRVVMAGGSGLYIKAVCEGFNDLPKPDLTIRKKLNNRHKTKGLQTLFNELKELDPAYAKKVNKQNPHRVIRALEVIHQTGNTFSSYREPDTDERSFSIQKIAINWDRQVLYDRINERVDEMIAQGLEEEARFVYQLPQNDIAHKTVGYSELFDFFEEKITREEAIRLIKRNTRRFAKRQLTWFRREEDIHWLQPDEVDQFVRETE